MELRLADSGALTETFDVDSREKLGHLARDNVRCVRAVFRDARIRDSEHATPPELRTKPCLCGTCAERVPTLSSDKSVHHEEAKYKQQISGPALIHSRLIEVVSSGHKWRPSDAPPSDLP
jgi:hypothetical protein